MRDYGEGAGEFVTAVLTVKKGETAQFFLNADGLGAGAAMKFELLTPDERPLPDYSGANAAFVDRSGFQSPIAWKNKTAVTGLPERYRIKASFEGTRKEAIRFSALYVQGAAKAAKPLDPER